jgi:hypothetical protein
MRRGLTLTGLALAIVASAALALSHVSSHLPPPLETVAQLPERLVAQVFPPRVPASVRLAGLTGPELNAVAALARRLGGLVVWSSNRTGNHELYLLDLKSGTVRQLTHTPYVEFFSRFSPDGRRIVFTRSQREYVSFRDSTAWDVYVISTDGTGERLLARGGDHLLARGTGDPARARGRERGARERPPGRLDGRRDPGGRGNAGDLP